MQPRNSHRPLSNEELHESFRDPGRKQKFVTAMFDVIAPRYDDFTRLFSFGMDARWKRYILRRIAEIDASPKTVLDLACGTGDIAFAILHRSPTSTVVGVDAAQNMIHAARARSAVATAPAFLVGDIMNLPVADARISLVTAGYAFRNVPDFRIALKRLAHLTQPGALLVTLDFYRPDSRLWRALFLGYLKIAGKVIGWLWHRSPAVYEYISYSIAHFVSATDFSRELESAGFQVIEERRWLLGGIAAHFARRSDAITRKDFR